MNSRQTKRLRMYAATAALLKTTTETSGLAGLPAKVTTLSANIDELNTLAATQTQLTEGRTARRDELLEHMQTAALAIANAVAAHATEQKLTELAPTVDVHATDFEGLRIPHRSWLAQRLHDAAASVLPELATYGVTAETLADLQAKIAAVEASLDQPRLTVVEKKAATDRMAELFDETDAALAQIDRLVYPLQRTSPEFYALYQGVRKIVGVPGSRREETSAAAQPAATMAAQPAPQQRAA